MVTPGRRLDGTRDTVIHEAVLGLLRETSYEAITMDAVAARASVGKNTIYRRWSGKGELVSDALQALKGPVTLPDHGSLAADLDAVAQLTAAADDLFDVRLVTGLLNALVRDAELREMLSARFLAPRGAGLREVFDRASARGELRADANVDLLVRIVPALLVYTFVTEGQLPDAASLRRTLDELVLPVTKETSADA